MCIFIDEMTRQETVDQSRLDLQATIGADGVNSLEIAAATTTPRLADMPPAIAELCTVIAERNQEVREENERFEAMLQQALSTPKASPKRLTQTKQRYSTDFAQQLNHIEKSLSLSKNEDRKFENYLMRVLNDN